jgi:hypothetical protein
VISEKLTALTAKTRKSYISDQRFYLKKQTNKKKEQLKPKARRKELIKSKNHM